MIIQKAEADDQVESIWDLRSEELVSHVSFTTISWVFLSNIQHFALNFFIYKMEWLMMMLK